MNVLDLKSGVQNHCLHKDRVVVARPNGKLKRMPSPPIFAPSDKATTYASVFPSSGPKVRFLVFRVERCRWPVAWNVGVAHRTFWNGHPKSKTPWTESTPVSPRMRAGSADLKTEHSANAMAEHVWTTCCSDGVWNFWQMVLTLASGLESGLAHLWECINGLHIL